jgi:rubrerythrin
MTMDIRERLTLRYLSHMVNSARGRAFILNQLADAEANGETQVFERVLKHVDDPALQKMIVRHQADEIRHAKLYREAAERQGVPIPPAPDHLKLIDRLDRAVGGFLSKPIDGSKGVMEAYVMLQVIEERGITQFKLLQQAFRDADPETADMIAVIAADEERHLRYCLAISKRYAPDEATRLATLKKYRDLEAQCFSDNGEAIMQHTFEKGYFSGGPVVRWFWKQVRGLGARTGELPYTSYAVAA